MDMWYRQLPGTLLLESERQMLDKLLPLMPGDFLLQIGGPSDLHLVSASPIKGKFYMNHEYIPSGYDTRIQTSLESLPIVTDSVDVIVLVHLMGFCKHPKHLLQEAYRCLKPGGQLIVFGFNYWSIWSWERLRKKRKGYPWQGHFQSAYQVKRWLYSMGYHVMMGRTLFFLPPVKKRPSARVQHVCETFGKICCPGIGGVYFIAAQKQQSCSDTLIGDWLNENLTVKKVRAEPSYMKREGVHET